MQISNEQIKRLEDEVKLPHLEEATTHPSDHLRASDGAIIGRAVRRIANMPDREDRIAELKAKIEAGEYQVGGEDIAESMIRRAIADRVR